VLVIANEVGRLYDQETPLTKIFISEAAKIWGVDNRTFDKYVKKGLIKVVEILPPNFRMFSKEEVIQKRKLVTPIKKRRKGLPVIMP